MKVLHLPTSVGGNAYGLAMAERNIGIDARVLYKGETWLKYPADIVIPFSSNAVFDALRLFSAGLKIYREYDVYHFNFGSTLLDFRGIGLDLFELPFIQKHKIAVTYNGCDARQKYGRMQQAEICACKYPSCYGGVCMDKSIEEKKEKRISKFQKYGASFFALNPDLMNFLPDYTVFLPYSIAGWDKIETEYDSKKYTSLKKIKIVHAPTNRTAKGSDAIVETIKRLQKKFPDRLELCLIENTPYDKALKLYRSADIIIDQIRIGWYGAFAVEAMKMGKPVIAYINEDDLHFIPKDMAKDCMEAVISANEFDLEEILGTLIDNLNVLKEKNEAQIEFVYKWHNPQYVAAITKKVYEE